MKASNTMEKVPDYSRFTFFIYTPSFASQGCGISTFKCIYQTQTYHLLPMESGSIMLLDVLHLIVSTHRKWDPNLTQEDNWCDHRHLHALAFVIFQQIKIHSIFVYIIESVRLHPGGTELIRRYSSKRGNFITSYIGNSCHVIPATFIMDFLLYPHKVNMYLVHC